jgi:GTP-binding protein Era
VRFFAQEFVRETCMELLREEVPYAITCQVDEFREDRDPVYVSVVIYVERESQKGIVIGKAGSSIKQIGQLSRLKIEELIGGKVYLEVRVKVMQDWRRKRARLERLGFRLPPPHASGGQGAG